MQVAFMQQISSVFQDTYFNLSSHSQSSKCAVLYENLKKKKLSHRTGALNIYFSHAEIKIQNKTSDNHKIIIY